ncbi:MAG: hypothetical protein WD342_14855 [Verrucomicrobiales bacterium]
MIDQTSHDFGVDLRYDNATEFLGRKNRFVAGATTTRGAIDDVRFSNEFGNRGARIADNDQTALNAGVYLQNSHYFLGDVALVAGSQFSYARVEMVETSRTPPERPGRLA